MKKKIILCAAFFALFFSGCAKAQTTWITDIDEASSMTKSTKKDLLIIFTGSDWNEPSKKLISGVFTADFFTTGSKDYVLCNIDIVQNETLMDKAQIEKNYKAATKYGIEALPYFILQTHEGDIYAAAGIPEQTTTTEEVFAYLDTFKEERSKLIELKNLVKSSKGAEKAKNIDIFIEALSPSRREQYESLIREVPELDAEGKAGLKGKYLLQVAYLDAVKFYQKGEMTDAGDIFIKLVDGGNLNAAQIQEAWYMGAYMYAMSKTVDNDKIIGWLEKAIAADPENPGSDQIKTTIEQIKTTPPKQTPEVDPVKAAN